LALLLGVASGAPGDPNALCTALLNPAGQCFALQFNQGAGAFPSQAQCVQWFSQVVPNNGSDTDTVGNTIGCRQHYANLAVNASTAWHCQFAGFTGGGLCGNYSDGGTVVYNGCAVGEYACFGNAFYPYANASATPAGRIAACVTELTPIANIWGSNQGVPGSTENSIECRVYHALVGGVNFSAGTAFHCGHTVYTAGDFGTNASVAQPCNPGGGAGVVAPNAYHHCAISLNFCTGNANAQYIDMTTCLAFFNYFPVGAEGVSPTNNTYSDQGSRQYHTQVAASSAANSNVHCSHGGPSGGNVCGTPRQAWNYMMQGLNAGACGQIPLWNYVHTSVLLAFNNWTAAAFNATVPTDMNAGSYSTTSRTVGNLDTCRIYHGSVAAEIPNPHCFHTGLFTNNTCCNDTAVACQAQQVACNGYSNEAACEADYNTNLMMLGKMGMPTTTGSDDSLACRFYWTTLALVALNAGGNATAQCMNVMATTGMCGGTMPGKSSALIVSASALTMLLPLFL